MGSQADQLRAFVADADVPCPNCGYSLRALTADRCPECREHLTLEVRITNSRLGGLIGAGAGLLAGAGAGATFFTVMGLYAVKRGGFSDKSAAFALTYYPVIVAVVEGLLAFFLLRAPGRTWFRRLPATFRALVILAGWGATACAVFFFMKMIPG